MILFEINGIKPFGALVTGHRTAKEHLFLADRGSVGGDRDRLCGGGAAFVGTSQYFTPCNSQRRPRRTDTTTDRTAHPYFSNFVPYIWIFNVGSFAHTRCEIGRHNSDLLNSHRHLARLAHVIKHSKTLIRKAISFNFEGQHCRF